ncbi:MAG: short-chain dehydrogenase/reductase [Epulopiscium sp. Nele67-Bin004]|nr:MAG: short-chain dehydrogenase/reductase [Epulopiscium sp. Nele67-Bin004]
MKTVVITGTSSGIGKATAIKFANEGYNVVATMRSPEKETELTKHENIKLLKLDVSKEDSIKQAVEEIKNQYSSIDILVNNAGYALTGPLELSSDAQIRAEFDVNVFGLINCIREFLPSLRESKGTIINISSMGGKICFPLLSTYHSTKFAVEGLSEGLVTELKQFGVKVKIVEPGNIATNFGTTSMNFAQGLTNPDNVYADMMASMQKAVSAVDTSSFYSTPDMVADVIFGASTDGTETIRYIAGDDAKQFIGMKEKMGDEAYLGALATNFGF